MNKSILFENKITHINNVGIDEYDLITSLNIKVSFDDFIKDKFPKYNILSNYFGFQFVDFVLFYKKFNSSIIQEIFKDLINIVPINMRLLAACMIEELHSYFRTSSTEIDKYVKNIVGCTCPSYCNCGKF